MGALFLYLLFRWAFSFSGTTDSTYSRGFKRDSPILAEIKYHWNGYIGLWIWNRNRCYSWTGFSRLTLDSPNSDAEPARLTDTIPTKMVQAVCRVGGTRALSSSV